MAIFIYSNQVRSYTILAKINKELPDTYAALGVDENAQFPDQLFNEAIRVIKDDISKGKLNLNNYFIIILWNQLHLFNGVWTT